MEEEAEGVIWGSFNEEMWGIGELTNSKIQKLKNEED